MVDNLKVDVVIANYNYGRYLDKCLASVYQQTYPVNDVYVIDNGSTDNSVEVASKYPVQLIQMGKPVGPSQARNEALKDILESDTNYVLIVDADDVIYPDKIEKLIEVMDVNTVVAYGDYHILNENTGLIREEFKKPFTLKDIGMECIVHSGSLISVDALRRIMQTYGYIYDPSMRTAEDWDLWIRCAQIGMIQHVPEFLTLVLDHDNNSTHSVNKNIWHQNWMRIKQKYS